MQSERAQTLALVPARGGSKRLPGKNLTTLGQHSLLGWSVLAGLRAPSVGRVVVSTDDPEIAREGRTLGAEVPFLRPSALSGDTASSVDVALHCLDFLAQTEGYKPEWLLLLQPTSPLRRASDIEASFQLTFLNYCQAVISVNEPVQHPLLAKVLDDQGRLCPLHSGTCTRRQDMPAAYNPNGAIYWVRVDVLRHEKTFYPPESLGFVMPLERSIDIDTPFDLEMAKLLLSLQEADSLQK